MNTRCLLGALALEGALAMTGMTADLPRPKWLLDTTSSTGNVYRETLKTVLADKGAVKQLESVLITEQPETLIAHQTRIFLARLNFSTVFVDYTTLIARWRRNYPQNDRSGRLAGILLRFTKQGPENKFVEEYVRDENGKIQFEAISGANNVGTLRGMRIMRKMVEKYTDADVAMGIARNAAARQAVLEHFLKFLEEGDAYEQSEIVDLVSRLWGSMSSSDRRREEPLADNLIEDVYNDGSRPVLVRYTAAMNLPENRQHGIQVLMLNIATNTMNTSEDLVNRALCFLESSGDANTLAVLKSQTNGPLWKQEKIERTSRTIESRLSATPKNNWSFRK
jgi:hypothetical protein